MELSPSETGVVVETRQVGSHAAELPNVNERVIRLWPAVLLAITGMSCMLVPTLLGMDDSIRFLILAFGAFLHLLLLGVWLLGGSGIPWRDRVIFFFLGLIGLALTFAFQHQSLGISIILFGTPIAATSLALVLLATRTTAFSKRRWLAFAAWVVPILLWLPTRSEGFEASFAPELRWRWSPDVEQRAELARKSISSQPKSARVVESVEFATGDWPQFRGVDRNGIADDSQLTVTSTIVPKMIWKRAIGPAWSSVAVVDGLLFTQEQRGLQEAVVCLDAATGDEVWSFTYDARFEDSTQVSGPGPRSTPTYSDGKIYTVGGTGIVTCLNAADGTLLWSGDLRKDCGSPVAMWGFSSSPVVVDGNCFLLGGGNGTDAKDAICYDAKTGEIRWASNGTGETYSSPQYAEFDNDMQVVASVGKSIVGRAVADGAERWRIEVAGMGNTMLQPIVMGTNQLLIASGEGDGTSLFEIQHSGDEWRTLKKWSSSRLRPDFNDVVVMDKMILGLTKGLLTCVSAEDGELLWKKFRFGSGQLIALPTSKCVLVLSEQGELNLIRVNEDEPTLVANWPAVEGKCWNHPVLVKDRVYCRSAEELACYALE